MRSGRLLRILLCISISALPTAAPGPRARADEVAVARADPAVQLAERLSASIPRDSFEPSALLKRLGTDATPEALFAYVRDSIRLVPYRGGLRGSRGTLMDGSGNSLDRSLLLGELLRLSGHQVRLANGTLSDDAAQKLLAEIAAAPELGGGETMASYRANLKTSLGGIASELASSAASLEPAIGDLLRSLEDRRAEIVADIKAQSAALARAVRLASGDVGVEVRRQSQDLRDHWWVRYQDATGTWIDLDPSHRQAQAGRTLTSADRVIDVDPGKPIDRSLPAELFHRLQVKVVIEQWRSDGVSEKVALAASFTPALTLEQPIAMRIVPVAWPKDAAGSADAVAAKLAAAKEWRPYLIVGNQATTGKAFDDRGFLTEDEPGAAKPSSGGLGGAFDRLSNAIDQLGGGQLTAAWIDYVVSAPGAPDETVRREIFDLAGPAARARGADTEPQIATAQTEARALALSQSVEILPMVGWIGPSFITAVEAGEFARAGKALAADGSALAGQLGGLGGWTSLPLFALAHVRHLWSEHPGDVYLPALNILTSHAGPARDTGGALVYALSFDIVRNDVDVRPGAATNAPAARLSQGVADTIAEASLIPLAARHGNAAALFAASAAGNIPWHVVRDANSLAAIHVDADALARLSATLADHRLVVVPERPVTAVADADDLAWWQIDPDTGTTLGRDRRGWGDDTSEYSIEITISTGSLQPAAVVPEAAAAVGGEGATEYVVLIGFVTVCAWFPLLGKVSQTVADFQRSHGICRDISSSGPGSLGSGGSVPSVSGE